LESRVRSVRHIAVARARTRLADAVASARAKRVATSAGKQGEQVAKVSEELVRQRLGIRAVRTAETRAKESRTALKNAVDKVQRMSSVTMETEMETE